MKKEKKKPNWPRRIAVMLILLSTVIYMLVMLKIKTGQTKQEQQELKLPGVKISVQHEIYKYASSADKKVKAEAAKRFPDWKVNNDTRQEYISFANQHYQNALERIAKHYDISKEEVIKIVVKGLEKNWDRK